MKHLPILAASMAVLSLTALACGDDDATEDGSSSSSGNLSSSGGRDATASSSGTVSSSSGTISSSSGTIGSSSGGIDPDAGDASDPIHTIAVDLHELYAANPPGAPSSYGNAEADAPLDEGGTSWRFHSTPTGGANQKFELYVQLNAAGDGERVSPAIAQIHEYLGDITVADLANVAVHTNRHAEASPDFSLLVYTEPDGSGADNTWYHYRLHSELSNAADLNAPANAWNRFTSEAGANSLRFWDYRNKNLVDGVQPADNYFTLADMQAGPVQPAGVAEARDYRTEKIKYLSFSSYSSAANFDASIDGVEITLKNGKGVYLNLGGDAKVRHFPLSHAALVDPAGSPPSAGSSYGTPAADGYQGGRSWNFSRTAADGSLKFELHVPFVYEEGATPPAALWQPIRDALGSFTVADLDAVEMHTRRAADSADYSVLVYTTPVVPHDDAVNDRTWYRNKLTGPTSLFVGAPAAADTWNVFSTNEGAPLQIKFWDYQKNNDVNPGTAFTLKQAQEGPIEQPANRDYRAQTVKFITISTFSSEQTVNASIDQLRIALKDGRAVILDLAQ